MAAAVALRTAAPGVQEWSGSEPERWHRDVFVGSVAARPVSCCARGRSLRRPACFRVGVTGAGVGADDGVLLALAGVEVLEPPVSSAMASRTPMIAAVAPYAI